MKSKYGVTFQYIDSWLCKYTITETYEASNMKEACETAWSDARLGELKYDFLDIIKIELVE